MKKLTTKQIDELAKQVRIKNSFFFTKDVRDLTSGCETKEQVENTLIAAMKNVKKQYEAILASNLITVNKFDKLCKKVDADLDYFIRDGLRIFDTDKRRAAAYKGIQTRRMNQRNAAA